jgi:hypothetical protein
MRSFVRWNQAADWLAGRLGPAERGLAEVLAERRPAYILAGASQSRGRTCWAMTSGSTGTDFALIRFTPSGCQVPLQIHR